MGEVVRLEFSSDAFQLDIWRPSRVEFGMLERSWAETDESIPPERATTMRFRMCLLISLPILYTLCVALLELVQTNDISL